MRNTHASGPGLSRALWLLAALRVQIKLARLGLALRAFDPNQPRVPAGSPGGGQWTDAGGGVGTSADGRFDIVQLDPKRRIEINPDEERNYGHAFTRHVGRTDAEMLQEMRPLPSIYPIPLEFRPVSFGTFNSLQDAKYYVDETLNGNRERVADIIARRSGEGEPVVMRFGNPTGREAFRPSAFPKPAIRPTYEVRVVIRADPRRTNGFSVISAFPINRDGRPR